MKENIGQKLRQAREARLLSLEQVAQATHMRAHYLQALEAGDFDALPSLAQARGFLRTYANFLRLDASALLAELEEEPAAPPLPPAAPASSPAREKISSIEADAIFVEIGQRLQRQRELLGLSLDDIVRHTHLRRHHLLALESGDLKELPSPVQGRGMLSNYAAFLGMDPEPLMLRFADGLQTRLKSRQAAIQEERDQTHPRPTQRRRALPGPIRRFFSSDFIVGGLLILLMTSAVVWGAIRIFAMRSNQALSPTAPSVAQVLLASPSASLSPTPATETPTSPAQMVLPTEIVPEEATAAVKDTAGNTLTPGAQNAVQVYITIQQRAWMRVLVDGKVEFEGRVIPGSAYAFVGKERVEILTGNAAALQIFFNQRDLGLLGLFGQVVNQIYTLEGIQTPTPTVRPTGTATPRATATPVQTATSRSIVSPRTATAPALP